MEEENNNIDEYRDMVNRELDEKIKKFTSYLNAPVSRDAPFTVRVVEPAVHDGHRKRMRNSAVKDRILDSFSDVELLEYLLSFVIPRKDTNVTSHKLLDEYDSMSAVLAAPKNELKRFGTVTDNAASVIAALKNISRIGGAYKIRLRSRHDVTDLFGAVYAAGYERGMYIAFLDGNSTLSAIELIKFDPKTAARTVVRSAVKRRASKIIMVWRDDELLGSFGLSRFISDLNAALDCVGVELVDFVMFIEYGYYTLCTPRRNYGGWSPQYMFIPEQKYATSPTALMRVHDAFDDEPNGIERGELAAQLKAVIARRSRRSG